MGVVGGFGIVGLQLTIFYDRKTRLSSLKFRNSIMEAGDYPVRLHIWRY
ncbi:MAG: hypothetical protein ACFFFG_11745 [Candidatus Thorarchaeota archaeon]